MLLDEYEFHGIRAVGYLPHFVLLDVDPIMGVVFKNYCRCRVRSVSSLDSWPLLALPELYLWIWIDVGCHPRLVESVKISLSCSRDESCRLDSWSSSYTCVDFVHCHWPGDLYVLACVMFVGIDLIMDNTFVLSIMWVILSCWRDAAGIFP